MSRILETRKAIAELMADGKERTTREIAERVGVHVNSASRNLRQMREWGLVASETVGGVNHFTTWRSIVRAAE